MVSDSVTFIAHVAAHAGITSERAEAVTRTVLARIGTSLSPDHRRTIADELPPALGAALMAPEVMVDDAMSLHQRELVVAVYRVLAEELSADAVAWLRDELPERMAELLVAGAPPIETSPQHGRTLATGSPGSDRPVSETHPQPSHDTLAEGRPGSQQPISERRR
jgi:uncharacterized protein (DUF2267 family)